MRAAFDYSVAAKASLSRRSRLGTHTRSIQAHIRAVQSSPPRPLWLCSADTDSRSCRSSKGLSRHTTPCGRVLAPTPPVTTSLFAMGSRRKKKEPIGLFRESMPRRALRATKGTRSTTARRSRQPQGIAGTSRSPTALPVCAGNLVDEAFDEAARLRAKGLSGVGESIGAWHLERASRGVRDYRY
jgi:hypothetical protein